MNNNDYLRKKIKWDERKSLTKELVGVVLIFMGAIIMSFDTIGSIIYCIYLWGGQGHELGYSIWEAAKVWLVLMGVGFLMLFIGWIIELKN